jgi:hypothetical protein
MNEEPSKLRETKEELIVDILGSLQKPTISIVTGRPGAGKTDLLQEIARQLRSTPNAPPVLQLFGRKLDASSVSRVERDFTKSDEILIVDGLDELERSDELHVAVARLFEHVFDQGGRVLAASRMIPNWLQPAGLPLSEFELTDRIRVADLDLPVEIYVDPGDATKETLQELFEAISDCHVAAGGLGLEFKTDGNSVFEILEVQQ